MRKEKTECSARLPFAVSMLVFGTIGLLRRFIDLPSGVIACFRGLLGCVLLLQRRHAQKVGGQTFTQFSLPPEESGGFFYIKRIGCGYHANSPLSYKILWRYYTPFSRINRRICGTSQKYELAVNLLTNFLKKRKETGKMIQD